MLTTDKKRKHVRAIAGVAPDAIAAAIDLMGSTWDERKQAEFLDDFLALLDEIRGKQPYRFKEVPTRQVPTRACDVPALHIGTKPMHYTEVLIDHRQALPSLNPLTIGTVTSKGTAVESFFEGQVLKVDSLEGITFVLLTEVYAPQDFEKRAIIIGKGVYLYNARNLRALIAISSIIGRRGSKVQSHHVRGTPPCGRRHRRHKPGIAHTAHRACSDTRGRARHPRIRRTPRK